MARPSLSLLILALVSPTAHACSANTHAIVAHRAITYYTHIMPDNNLSAAHASAFNDILRDYPEHVVGGAPSPDIFNFAPFWPLASNPQHGEWAEAAHWPPWHTAACIYIREKYGTDPTKWKDGAPASTLSACAEADLRHAHLFDPLAAQTPSESSPPSLARLRTT